MDKALKQRLVGASVLIALAVIILPMLLGGKPESGQQTSEQIEIPARPDGVSFETRRFPLGSEPAAPQTGSASIEQTAASDESGDANTDTSAVAAGLNADPAAAAPLATGETGDAADSLPDTAPDTPVEPEGPPPVAAVEIPVSKKVDIPVEVPRSEPESGRSSAKSTGVGRYAVQVASLASDANARKLQSELEAKGFKVISDRIESDVGRLNRIRVGPFESEADAAAAVKKIQGQFEGVNPRLVDLDPAGAQTLSPSDPLVRWVVQLGSFGEASNAENLVKQVREQGLSAYSERVTSSSGSVINRVRVGPFLQREDASSAQTKLQSSLGINGVVMSAD